MIVDSLQQLDVNGNCSHRSEHRLREVRLLLAKTLKLCACTLH